MTTINQIKALKVGETLAIDKISISDLMELRFPENYEQRIINRYEPIHPIEAYKIIGTLNKPVETIMWNWEHPYAKNTTTKTLPVGTHVRVIMVSRLGDIGITERLEATNGYDARIQCQNINNIVIECIKPCQY